MSIGGGGARVSDSERSANPTVHNDLSGSLQGHVVQAGSVGQIHFHDGSGYPVPSQLPPPPGFFTSRDRELAELERWFGEDSGQPLLAVISGPGGVGKTTLALRWLHDVRHHFTDGQLYVNLGAFSANRPATPEEVLEWFLLALGLPADRVPPGLPQREALYRSFTADRAIAVLLDDALSVAQVRPLLPASQRCVVVVTSRWRLAGLRTGGARFIAADPMDIPDSVTLLNRLIGDDRPAREHRQVEELARLCGGMPLALSVLGARLGAHPNRPLAREVGDLSRQDRLASLSRESESSVEAVFDTSYRELPTWERQVYRWGALHPGDSLAVDVLAAATGRSADETERALDALVERNLLTEVGDRRFRYHDLLLVHARQQAAQEDDLEARDAAVRRMIEWYLDVAVVADLVLRPTRRRVGPRFDSGWRRPVTFSSHHQALGWLAVERGNILSAVRAAADHGWDNLSWEFCEALWGFFLHARHYDDWLELHRIGIPAAHRRGQRVAEARLRIQLGSALFSLHRRPEARQEHHRALELAEQERDELTVAAAVSELASVARGDGDLDGALEYLRRAKGIRETLGTPRSVALSRRLIGDVLMDLGRFEDAVVELAAAATAMDRLGDVAQRARALTSLGWAYTRWGRPADAAEPLTTALGLAEQVGSRYYRADVLAVLGDVAIRSGRPAEAEMYLTEALETYRSSGDPKADAVAARLADVPGHEPAG
jgi:tetratricopeptide (TPR) repeat protein